MEQDVAASTTPLAGRARQELTGATKKACTAMLLNMVKVQRGRAVLFPGSNPVSIERASIPALQQEEYWVAAKTDGQRALLLAVTAGGRRLCVVVDRAMRMFVVPGTLPTVGFEGSLLDGEVVQARDGLWRFLAFDSPHLSGVNLAHSPFSVRMAFVRAWLCDAGAGPDGLRLEAKRFVPYGTRLADEGDLPSDGLIFMPEAPPYVPFRSDKLFKWKAGQQHTVDFQVDRGRLMVLNRGKLVEKSRLHPDDDRPELQGAVVECGLAGGAWRVHRLRPDKAAPNDAYVYGKTNLNIQENITRSEFNV